MAEAVDNKKDKLGDGSVNGSDNRYRGRIVAIDSAGVARVTLLDGELKCTGCAIASACGSRPAGREVVVPLDGVPRRVGEEVTLECPPSSSSRAMTLGIVVPTVILAALSGLLYLAGIDDTLTAIIALCAVAVYYLVLLLLRKKINRRLRWRIVD